MAAILIKLMSNQLNRGNDGYKNTAVNYFTAKVK